MQCIYQVVHRETGNCYIGSAVNFKARISVHRWRLNSGVSSCKKLQAAWSKYGQEAFDFLVIEEVKNREDLVIREQYWIDTLCPRFNIVTYVTAPMLGRKQSERFFEAQHDKKGMVVPQERRDRIAATLRGRKNGPRSDDVRAKISETLQGHTVSVETRDKISAQVKGFRHTEEAKKCIGESSKKRIPWNKNSPGRKHSEETKAKISMARRETTRRKKEESGDS